MDFVGLSNMNLKLNIKIPSIELFSPKQGFDQNLLIFININLLIQASKDLIRERVDFYKY